jgi:hypothetical protein
VTSVAFSTPLEPDQVSPELALVDPDLAARARALLPEPPDALASPSIEAPKPDAGPAPYVAAESPTAPEGRPADMADTLPAALSPSNVLPLRPRPLVETREPATVVSGPLAKEYSHPRPEVEVGERTAMPESALAPGAGSRTGTAGVWLAAAMDRTSSSAGPVAAALRQGAAAHRRMLVAFAAGAVAASFVVVGVIAALGESGGQQAAADGGSPALVPPTVVSPTPPPASSTRSPGAGKTPTAASPTKSSVSAKKGAASAKTSSVSPKKAAAAKKSAAAPAAATVPPRRFAWAPVDGAVGYRVELFRGDQQVLQATTTDPVYELPGAWRHKGRAERLTAGGYRWYVWPVLSSGPAAEAVVQAKLTVP